VATEMMNSIESACLIDGDSQAVVVFNRLVVSVSIKQSRKLWKDRKSCHNLLPQFLLLSKFKKSLILKQVAIET
jgi:hypothetical protein